MGSGLAGIFVVGHFASWVSDGQVGWEIEQHKTRNLFFFVSCLFETLSSLTLPVAKSCSTNLTSRYHLGAPTRWWQNKPHTYTHTHTFPHNEIHKHRQQKSSRERRFRKVNRGQKEKGIGALFSLSLLLST